MDGMVSDKEECNVFEGFLDEGEEMCCSSETGGRVGESVDWVGGIRQHCSRFDHLCRRAG